MDFWILTVPFFCGLSCGFRLCFDCEKQKNKKRNWKTIRKPNRNLYTGYNYFLIGELNTWLQTLSKMWRKNNNKKTGINLVFLPDGTLLTGPENKQLQVVAWDSCETWAQKTKQNKNSTITPVICGRYWNATDFADVRWCRQRPLRTGTKVSVPSSANATMKTNLTTSFSPADEPCLQRRWGRRGLFE